MRCTSCFVLTKICYCVSIITIFHTKVALTVSWQWRGQEVDRKWEAVLLPQRDFLSSQEGGGPPVPSGGGVHYQRRSGGILSAHTNTRPPLDHPGWIHERQQNIDGQIWSDWLKKQLKNQMLDRYLFHHVKQWVRSHPVCHKFIWNSLANICSGCISLDILCPTFL